MFKSLVRYLLLTLLTIFAATRVVGQTITIGTVDPGPYSQGSTVAVPFHIDDALGCMSKTNVFTVEMSDATGSFASPTVVGTLTGFYATFVNITIPNGTTAGNGYKFRVKASSPGVVPTNGSNDVTINTTAGPNAVVAAASLPTITAEVFGQCNGPASGPYTIYDNNSGATTLKASFFNESTQTLEAADKDILGAGYQFTANQATYTVTVKATNASGKISTKAYLLINNQINSSIGQSGNGTVCIAPGPGGTAPLTYNIDITGVNGIQKNYPGNLYTFSWGDGTANTVLTLCEIIALGGQVTHPYARPSCGNVSGQNNRFQVDITISNPYCGVVGSPVTSYARILTTPTNVIQGPANNNLCTGATVTFGNGSNPGVDPNSNTLTCDPNPNARFTWYVDGVLKTSPAGVPIANGFTYTFNTRGTHTVLLRALNSNGGACTAADATFSVCVQDPPTASFTVPPTPVCMNTPFTPTNTTNPDVICNANYTYLWTIDKNTYTFGSSGTSLTSFQPQFNFTAPGVYNLTLKVTAPGGCTSTTVAQSVVVAATPTAVLAGNQFLCGSGQTLTFDDTPNSPTRVTFAGASVTEGSTFLWEVTGGTYSFANGTTATSENPQIKFDDFGTYHIKVTRTNACGDAFATQDINFQNAPTVDAGTVPPFVCQAPSASTPAVVALNGSITGTYTSLQWLTSGSGTFSAGNNTSTNYTPSNTDYNTGVVVLTLSVNSGLSGACATVSSSVTLNLTKRTVITGPQTLSICSNNKVGYNISANNPSSFTWTATLVKGSPSGFASGSGPTVDDLLVNLDPANDAAVKYTITPTNNNGCPGDPFELTVTIPSLPAITFAPPPAICSDSQAGISFATSKPGATRYMWTVSAPASVTGGHDQTAFTTNNVITDRLVNSGTTTATVTYTITPYNTGTTCPGAPVTISVDVYPAPVTSNAGADQALCGQTSTALQGNSPGTGTGKWIVVTNNSGTPLTFDDDASPTAIVSGLKDGNTYTLQWTITSPNGCTSQDQVNISVTAASVGGTTSGAVILCPGPNTGAITLSGNVGNVVRWESSIDNGGSWQTAAGTNTTTTYTYNNLAQTTQFRAVVMNGNCTSQASSPTTITINQAAPVATVGQTQKLCSTTTATLTGNDPGTFVGVWRQTAGPAATITDSTYYQSTVNGLIGDSTYIFQWTIAGSAPCPSTSASLTIIVYAPAVAGTTSGADTVCAGGNNGNITLSGKHGNILRWLSSVDNGSTWQTAAGSSTSATYTYNNLSKTTLYRAIVQNGSICSVDTSTITIITVNPPSVIADAGTNQILCNQPTYTLQGNDPGIFTGTWTQTGGPAVTITDIHNPQSTVTGLTGANTYTFRWTITGLPPCADSYADVTITNNADVVASFTTSPKSGCGNLTVNFTNTSNNQPSAVFKWTFGDGATSNAISPQHVFAQRTDGRDTTYYISLAVIGNCVQRPALIDSVLVRPATPVARILPVSTTGCGNFAINVQNTSPGNNVSYNFYLYDGNTLVQTINKTDKTNAIFDPISTTARKTFTVYMIATGYCGTTNESTHVPIVISPSDVVAQMFIQNDVHAGCAPLNATFVNNSYGGNNFYYTVYDANNNVVDKPVASTASLPYTFTKAGTYYITITAINSCGMNESPRTRVDVFPVPAASFVADVTTACKNLRVTFTNNSVSNDPNTPATSLVYDWDFGDGTSHSTLFAPVHSYTTSGTYTVTLTATNTASGCSDVFTRQSYIVINAPPSTAFTVQPDSIVSIPNYTMSFVDKTKGNPITWRWQFSDGQTFNKQNPIVTFADTGNYKVTLTTTNALGCDSALTKTVRVDGVPGQLYLPNAFMPNSATNDLRVFRAKGSGIKQWHLQIFDIYGQLLWETTKLTAKGEPVEAWDGTFKGTPMPQGVYQWQASATFINGNEWKGNAYGTELPKRVGSIHLIK